MSKKTKTLEYIPTEEEAKELKDEIVGETYNFGYHCDNCGSSGFESMPKGTTRPNSVTCDNCGCSARTDTSKPLEERIWIKK